jgi:MoaA/NifB/PqqE/SkfB family radical SAM enzyme
MNPPAIVFAHPPGHRRDAQEKSACIRLPVAPCCNIQCNFCNRKYDCLNEGRPRFTHRVLTPQQAVTYLERVVARHPEISSDIAGPGDPFRWKRCGLCGGNFPVRLVSDHERAGHYALP